MKKILVSAVFLGAFSPLAFSMKESDAQKDTSDFAFQYNCKKEEPVKLREDKADPCEQMVQPTNANNTEDKEL